MYVMCVFTMYDIKYHNSEHHLQKVMILISKIKLLLKMLFGSYTTVAVSVLIMIRTQSRLCILYMYN